MRPKKVVLCVDSCEFRLSRLVFLLQTWGFQVLRAESSKEALAILKRATPDSIHVMVCDLLMPDMDGNELTRRAKQLHPTLPVLLRSDVVTSFDRALHADIFLPKGANTPAELVARVRVLAARRRGPKKQLATPVYLPATEERVVA